jgi:hypothetical protein
MNDITNSLIAPQEKIFYKEGDIVTLRNNGYYLEMLSNFTSNGDQILEMEVKAIKTAKMIIE